MAIVLASVRVRAEATLQCRGVCGLRLRLDVVRTSECAYGGVLEFGNGLGRWLRLWLVSMLGLATGLQ